MSEAPDRPRSPVIAEMSEVAYQTWRHHPVTRGFLQFLAGQAREYREGAADLWAAGLLAEAGRRENADVLRGRYLAITELTDLPLEVLKGFYGIEDQPEGETT